MNLNGNFGWAWFVFAFALYFATFGVAGVLHLGYLAGGFLILYVAQQVWRGTFGPRFR